MEWEGFRMSLDLKWLQDWSGKGFEVAKVWSGKGFGMAKVPEWRRVQIGKEVWYGKGF